MMNGKVRAFNGDMGMAMSVFKDMVGKVRFVFADPPYKITQARYDKEGFDYKSMWEVIQKMLCPDGVVAVTCSLTAAVEIMRVAPAGWYRYDLVKFDYISNALEDYTDVSVSAYYCESNNKRNVNRKPNIGMIKEYMDFIEDMNNDEDEEEKIVYDTILMIGDASGKEGQFSDSDKKTAENFGCEYMDVDDFVYKYNNR